MCEGFTHLSSFKAAHNDVNVLAFGCMEIQFLSSSNGDQGNGQMIRSDLPAWCAKESFCSEASFAVVFKTLLITKHKEKMMSNM